MGSHFSDAVKCQEHRKDIEKKGRASGAGTSRAAVRDNAVAALTCQQGGDRLCQSRRGQRAQTPELKSLLKHSFLGEGNDGPELRGGWEPTKW